MSHVREVEDKQVNCQDQSGFTEQCDLPGVHVVVNSVRWEESKKSGACF